MAEKEFFNHDGVIITSSRAVFRDTMYPISSISAVEQVKTKVFVYFKPIGYLWIVLFILCIVYDIYFIMNISYVKYGRIFFLVLQICITASLFSEARSCAISEERFNIKLYVLGKNTKVFSSTSKKDMEDIVKAINEAIIARS